MNGPKFVILRGRLSRQYRVRLVGGNNETLMVSESFKTKRAAVDAVALIRRVAAEAPLDNRS